jgi:hypothetical protein
VPLWPPSGAVVESPASHMVGMAVAVWISPAKTNGRIVVRMVAKKLTTRDECDAFKSDGVRCSPLPSADSRLYSPWLDVKLRLHLLGLSLVQERRGDIVGPRNIRGCASG